MNKQLRILIITGALYPNMTVTSEISYRIAHVLSCNYNCEITIMGYRNNDNSCDVSNPYRFNTVNVSPIDCKIRVGEEYKNYILDNGLKPENRIKKMQLIISDRKYRNLFIKYKKNCTRNNEKEYYKYLRRMELEGIYDCIIAFFHPIDPISAVVRLKPNVPTIFYKLDPWSTDSNEKKIESTRKKEERADSFSNAIVTTRAIANEYKNGLLSIPNNTCVYALDFPNIVQYKKTLKKLQEVKKETINCVFTGSFYEGIRSPDYVLDLFSLLGDGRNIVFHIFGNYEFFFRFNDLPNYIIYHGRVSSEDSIGIMQDADILVNIGNTTINQFPSKIITYISLGKPIINIIKRTDCPTLPYMEKYPLALNILETPEPTEEDIARVREFILTNRGKHIPFETIKELYYDCTPEYVGGKVYEIICKVVEESKRSKNK